MIARQWQGRVPLALADAYRDLMHRVALPDYRATPGNRAAYCLTREEGSVVHFTMLTLWDDLDAIRRFAGDDVERAKYYDFDHNYLLELEPYVRHFDAVAG